MSPEHYSSQLPSRCLELLNDCWLDVSKRPKVEHGGPLTTTLLLTMSMPILLLPLERVESFSSGDEAYGSEVSSHPEWASAFLRVFKEPKLRNVEEFFEAKSWSFATASTDLRLNRLPADWLAGFHKPQAYEEAANLQVRQWARILRNSLAHGNVAYLDTSGQPTPGARAEMLLFVSEKREYTKPCDLCGRKQQIVTGLQCLRISVPKYRSFISAWVEWLRSCGAEKGMASEQRPAA